MTNDKEFMDTLRSSPMVSEAETAFTRGLAEHAGEAVMVVASRYNFYVPQGVIPSASAKTLHLYMGVIQKGEILIDAHGTEIGFFTGGRHVVCRGNEISSNLVAGNLTSTALAEVKDDKESQLSPFRWMIHAVLLHQKCDFCALFCASCLLYKRETSWVVEQIYVGNREIDQGMREVWLADGQLLATFNLARKAL